MSLRAARQSVAQQIVGIIRELGLQPGNAIPTELDLIARLDVSRNTVREAIRDQGIYERLKLSGLHTHETTSSSATS